MTQDPHPATASSFEWDEHNSDKLAARYITEADVEWVHGNSPTYTRNKRSATGTWLMIGTDNGGRTLTISILWADTQTRTLRAITGWVN